MTLVTLLFAWLPLLLLFAAWARVLNGRINGLAIIASALEALVLTLLAGLWFGSLGHGGWALVFLLLGLLVGGAERGLRSALLRSAFRPELKGMVSDVARYLAAGALLAWRLG